MLLFTAMVKATPSDSHFFKLTMIHVHKTEFKIKHNTRTTNSAEFLSVILNNQRHNKIIKVLIVSTVLLNKFFSLIISILLLARYFPFCSLSSMLVFPLQDDRLRRSYPYCTIPVPEFHILFLHICTLD